METIGKRLRFYLDKNKISASEFSENTGIPLTSVYRTLNSDNGITSTTLAKIYECYPNINITWLITGNGHYVTNDNREVTVEEDREPYLTKSDSELKTKVRTILNNEVVLDAFIEILKRYDK